MKKIYLTLLLLAACAVSQMGCDDQVCDGNCDDDYIVSSSSYERNNDYTAAVISIKSKEGLTNGNSYEEKQDHYCKYEPVLTIGTHSFKSSAFIEHVYHGSAVWLYHDNADDIYTSQYHAPGGRVVYTYIVETISSPASSDAGKILASFYHATQTNNRKIYENVATWYFDVTQDPPELVTKSEYNNLTWVKKLKDAGK